MVHRGADPLRPSRPVDEAEDLGLRGLRPDVRAAVGEGRHAVRKAAEHRVADRRDAARAVELFAHRRRAHVLRHGRPETQLIDDGPVETALPRVDCACARVVRQPVGGIEVHLFDDASIFHQRQEELREGLLDVLRPAGERDVGELDFHAVARRRVAARDAANTLRRVVGHHGTVAWVGVDVAAGAYFDDLREIFPAPAHARGHRDRPRPTFGDLAVGGHFPDVLVDRDDSLLVLRADVVVGHRLGCGEKAVRMYRRAGLEAGNPVDRRGGCVTTTEEVYAARSRDTARRASPRSRCTPASPLRDRSRRRPQDRSGRAVCRPSGSPSRRSPRSGSSP